MKAPASAPFASEEMARWQLHADLHLGIGYAMSLLELQGWLAQARRASDVGAFSQDQLDALLEEAKSIGNARQDLNGI